MQASLFPDASPLADAGPALPHAVSVGCAGWSLPRALWPEFVATGTHLQRYATRLNAVEINSSFYRPHQRPTYVRWAASVPESFRFSVKLPKLITHQQRLLDCAGLLDDFLAQASGLGDKLGRHNGPVALEPRHASWFDAPADALLNRWQVTRVLADPVMHPAGHGPGGFAGLIYVRLHGSPRMYYSAYALEVLDALAGRLALAAQSAAGVWCIFDNTAECAAPANALYTTQALAQR